MGREGHKEGRRDVEKETLKSPSRYENESFFETKGVVRRCEWYCRLEGNRLKLKTESKEFLSS